MRTRTHAARAAAKQLKLNKQLFQAPLVAARGAREAKGSGQSKG